MAQILERELEKLKKQIFELCAMIEENFQEVVQSLIEFDNDQAEKVIKHDDDIDNKEIEVEEECLKILALHQPVAIDLRFIIAALKINNELERIGDLAVNIAKRIVQIIKLKKIELSFDFNELLTKSMAMLHKSIDAFINFDTKTCYEVIAADDEVDKLNKKMFVIFKEGSKRNPEDIDILLHYLSISRCLERIADHATNIAEDVIYMINGDIVRHTQ